MFPSDEMSARSIASDKTAEVFTTYVKDGRTVFVVPSNLREFSKNLLMIAILKAASLKNYSIETSLDKEVPEKILKTEDASFVAGYVFQAHQEVLGPLVTDSSKFAKGRAAYQRSCIQVYHSSSRHLKKDGDKILTKRLSEMKSFTQAYWSLRTRIVSLLTSLPKKSAGDDLRTYVKSKEDLNKLIHTQLVWRNRGVFRSEEIAYLDSRHSAATDALMTFKDSFENPTLALARDFDAAYAPIKNGIRTAEAEIVALYNRRSDILFLKNAKKKRDVEYNKMKLLDKIAGFTEHGKLSAFIPATLPGIGLLDATVDIMQPVRPEQLETTWSRPANIPQAWEVVTSWNAYLAHFLQSED